MRKKSNRGLTRQDKCQILGYRLGYRRKEVGHYHRIIRRHLAADERRRQNVRWQKSRRLRCHRHVQTMNTVQTTNTHCRTVRMPLCTTVPTVKWWAMLEIACQQALRLQHVISSDRSFCMATFTTVEFVLTCLHNSLTD